MPQKRTTIDLPNDRASSEESEQTTDSPPVLNAAKGTPVSLDSHSVGFALTAEQAQLNAIFAGVAEAIVLVDEEGEVQRINPAFTRVINASGIIDHGAPV